MVAELPLEPLDAVASPVVRAAAAVSVAVLDLALRVAQLALLALPARLAHALTRDVGTVRVAEQRAHTCKRRRKIYLVTKPTVQVILLSLSRRMEEFCTGRLKISHREEVRTSTGYS